MLEQLLVPSSLQRNVIIVGDAIVPVHGVALPEQQLGKMVANEPGGSGDEYAFQSGLANRDGRTTGNWTALSFEVKRPIA
jgi:hypothetical protein